MICIELLNPIRDIIDPPKPKWREAVDERLGWAAELPSPLGSTLRELSDLEYGKVDSYADPTTVCLARIIAVAEAQVGDGWQAEPAVWPMTPNLTTLLVYLTDRNGYGEPRWRDLGNAAAAWLRDLTEDGSDD